MSLTPGFATAVDLFHKLQRDASRLNSEVTSDAFFDFVVTGYSIIDWVEKDQSLPAAARKEAKSRTLHKEHWLKACGDLANSSKHFVLDRRTPVVVDASSNQGFGVGRYGVGGYGVGEEIILKIDNGTEWTALEFVTGVIQAWIMFFERNGIDFHSDASAVRDVSGVPMYKVHLMKTIWSTGAQTEIFAALAFDVELPFPPVVGLVIRHDGWELGRIEHVYWDVVKAAFDVRVQCDVPTEAVPDRLTKRDFLNMRIREGWLKHE